MLVGQMTFVGRAYPEQLAVHQHFDKLPHCPAALPPGKTTCAVFRMFDHWRAAFEAGEPLHQVFVTVSATLKEQVGRQWLGWVGYSVTS